MDRIYFLLIFAIFLSLFGCQSTDHEGMMDQTGMDDQNTGMMGAGGHMSMDEMMSHMRQMSDRTSSWMQHMGPQAGDNQMHAMTSNMHQLSQDMTSMMETMRSMMADRRFQDNEAFQNHLKQMEEHMSQMVQGYDSMLSDMGQLREMQPE